MTTNTQELVPVSRRQVRTTSIAIRQPEPQVVPLSFDQITSMAEVFAKSGYFEDARQMAQGFVKIQAGQELGIPPLAAMQGIHIIKGKPALSANLMGGAIKRSNKYDFRVIELTEKNCEIHFFERKGGRDEQIGVSTFSFADATKAGTQNTQKYPRNMLFARALSNGVRWYCPDVFYGPVYTPEEFGGYTNDAGDVFIEAEDRPSLSEPPPGASKGDRVLQKMGNATVVTTIDEPATSKKKPAEVAIDRFMDTAAKHGNFMDQHSAIGVVRATLGVDGAYKLTAADINRASEKWVETFLAGDGLADETPAAETGPVLPPLSGREQFRNAANAAAYPVQGDEDVRLLAVQFLGIDRNTQLTDEQYIQAIGEVPKPGASEKLFETE